MADDDLVDIAARSGHRRRRLALVAMGTGGVAAGLALGAFVMRAKPCDVLARELCAGDTSPQCQQLGAKLVEIGVTQSDCREARQAIEAAPPSKRDSVRMSAVMRLLQGRVEPAGLTPKHDDARAKE